MILSDTLTFQTLFPVEPEGPWRRQREWLLAAIRREPDPQEAASLHSAGLSETAVKFVKQQSCFVHNVKKTVLTNTKQQCILVGCVPSATVAVCWGEGGACSRAEVSAPGAGVPVPRGCLLRGGWGCLLWGVPAPGGSAPGWGCGISACTEPDPPVDRMTDRCKNITFPTSLRTVKMTSSYRQLRLECGELAFLFRALLLFL